MDLITNPEENADKGVDGADGVGGVSEEVGREERLDGRVVAAVWRMSKLERGKLKEIWYVWFFLSFSLSLFVK